MSIFKDTRPCHGGAQEWADAQENDRTAWGTCERGDWMLQAALGRGVNSKVLTGAKAECAGIVEHLMRDDRSVGVLRAAERFATGKDTTSGELGLARIGAAEVAYFAAAYDITTYAAAKAAEAVTDTIYAATDTSAAYAAEASGGADTLKQCADIVRKWIKFEDLGAG